MSTLTNKKTIYQMEKFWMVLQESIGLTTKRQNG